MDIEEINSDRDKFLGTIQNNLEGELDKVGLRLMNVNITDIQDESGYISALGKEAASKFNDAKVSVAKKQWLEMGQWGNHCTKRHMRIQTSDLKHLLVGRGKCFFTNTKEISKSE
jgi:flotillin